MPSTLPPEAQIDKRKAVAHKVVAHVHHVRLGKEDDAVAVGVTARKMQGSDVLAVEVHGHIVIEGENRQGFLGLRLDFATNRSEIARRAALFQTLADVVVGDHGRLFLEDCVSAGVVAVIVGVDDETNRLVGDPLQRGLDLVGQGSILVIDDYDAIIAHRCADIPA